jgi:hypothetical protein
MPDNNNDLNNRLMVLSQTIGLRENTQPTNPNNTAVDNQQEESITINLNWKALYKWLESEVEELILNPNASAEVKAWAESLIANGQAKMREFQNR